MKGVTRQTGIISDIDEAVVRVRVTLPECDNLRSNWLAVLQRNTQDNKDYWLPDIGEQVEVLLDDNGEDGVVLARFTPAWIPRRWPRATSATCSFPTARPLNMTVRYTSSPSTAA
ncbi:baseplate protein [Salmonella enterica subsp. enterica]|uniref:Baseplate protein n=1 Tax=Salmonella enterica I TaxID=59201 RepID=A0A379VYI9_SALET|nr:baseplate protein [Salmonella enterica subsp. enterica]